MSNYLLKSCPNPKFRPLPPLKHKIVYPFNTDKEIKFNEMDNKKYLATLEIRNLSPFPMMFKLLHANPAIAKHEFEIRETFGMLGFEQCQLILVSPLKVLPPHYIENTIFELWIAPNAILQHRHDNQNVTFNEDWPNYVDQCFIMKISLSSTVQDSQKYLEKLLMKNLSEIIRSPRNPLFVHQELDYEADTASTCDKQVDTVNNSQYDYINNKLDSFKAIRTFVKQVIKEQQRKLRRNRIANQKTQINNSIKKRHRKFKSTQNQVALDSNRVVKPQSSFSFALCAICGIVFLVLILITFIYMEHLNSLLQTELFY